MAKIFYARTEEDWRRGQKYAFLDDKQHLGNVEWQELHPDAKHNWLTEGMREEFETFTPLGKKKAGRREVAEIFGAYSNGIKSNNDAYVYNFDVEFLRQLARQMVDDYNTQVDRWKRQGAPDDLEGFLQVDESRLKWIRNTKRNLLRGKYAEFAEGKLREAVYRPFCKQFYYFERIFNEEIYQIHTFFPAPVTENENRLICLTDAGSEKPFMALLSNRVPDLHLTGAGCGSQCFPFYTYDEDGTNRRENVTDWALEKFRGQYGDAGISKWDVFHYVYAVLHHPAYRERYAVNLKRELPRVPFAPDFRAFAEAGARLADLHVNYESQPEFPLERIEAAGVALDWRVERMRLSKDRRSLAYNEFLTLSGIPAEVFDYRLGNRSALEWVVDQYRITTDPRSRITNDPNRPADPQYILRLVGQVVTVSLETVALVKALPDLGPTP